MRVYSIRGQTDSYWMINDLPEALAIKAKKEKEKKLAELEALEIEKPEELIETVANDE